jgi:uncharacterized iron-regulated protein
MSRTRLLHVSLAVSTLLTGACASGGKRAPVTAAAPVSAAAVRVYDTKAARFISFDQLIDAASKADVVYFGEQHDDPATHSAEVAVLAALGARRGEVVVTLEMFERDVQPLLDQYLSGNISEKNFLDGSRPWERYVTDYRPMIEVARVHGWPVIAGNVPRRIASAVAKKGLAVLDTMSRTERSYAAAQNQCPIGDTYYKKFAETMTGHGAGGGPPTAGDASAMAKMTDLFYEAQCVKDETMAESIANAMTRWPGRLVFQVDGAFHSDAGLGTAARVTRRMPTAKSVVLTGVPIADLSKADPKADMARADYLLFTRAPK